MGNRYNELRNSNQKRFNKVPMIFAFGEAQLAEAMVEAGLKPSDTDKIVSTGYGGYIKKEDMHLLTSVTKQNAEELQEAKDADTTGEGFIYEMFKYELANHEFGYTYELEDTLEALDLTMKQILSDKRLKAGLEKAVNEYKEAN
jgi:hypothetical protein